MSSSGQEAQMMSTEYTHIWPNKTVYYTFQTLLGKCMPAVDNSAHLMWAIDFIVSTVLIAR